MVMGLLTPHGMTTLSKTGSWSTEYWHLNLTSEASNGLIIRGLLGVHDRSIVDA